MDAKITIIFNRRKNATKKKDAKPATGSVEVQIYKDRKRKWIATGVKVFLDQWDNGIVVNRLDAADLNVKIRQAYEAAVEACGRNDVQVSALSDVHLGKKSFCDWMEERINERTDIAELTRSAHLRTVNSLREIGLFKSFADLTERNITLWDQALKRRLNKQSAVHGYHKRLKPYISMAIHLGLLKESPYRFVRVPRGRSEGIKYITAEERERIEALQLSGAIEVVRDMFIFACYTGLAFCDLVRVKDCLIQDGSAWFIDGSRLKTSVRYRLSILPKALEILERYDFDMNRMSNQKCNLNLKAIQAMANIKTNLTMHVGRHSFATWALNMGVPIQVVSKMLAHTNIVTTQIYAKVLQSEVAKGFNLLRGEASAE